MGFAASVGHIPANLFRSAPVRKPTASSTKGKGKGGRGGYGAAAALETTAMPEAAASGQTTSAAPMASLAATPAAVDDPNDARPPAVVAADSLFSADQSAEDDSHHSEAEETRGVSMLAMPSVSETVVADVVEEIVAAASPKAIPDHTEGLGVASSS